MNKIDEMSNLVANLEVFENEEFGQIRVISIEDEPWFIGKDVVSALGYDLSTGTSYTQYVKKHCSEEDIMNYNKETQVCSTLELDYKLLGQRGGLLINEYALYDLVLDSPLPSAKAFKYWITHEVLPTIRKTGGYIATTEEDDDATIMAKALMVAQRTIDSKNKQLEDAKKEIKEKDNVLNQFSISQNTKLVRETAKAISKSNSKIIIGERRLYEKMRNWGWICQGSTEPKQYAIDRGYLEVNEGTKSTSKGVFTYRTTRVTGKGEVKIVEKLLKENEVVSDFYS